MILTHFKFDNYALKYLETAKLISNIANCIPYQTNYLLLTHLVPKIRFVT